MISRPMNLGVMVGVLYEWSDEERKLIEKVENQFQILVYHVIRNVTNAGILTQCSLSLLMKKNGRRRGRR